MKFVYFGYDFMLPAVERLLQDGHTLLGIFSFECDNVFNFNLECQHLAQQNNIPLILSPVEDFHIKSFLEKGTEVFLSAGYPHKIPPIDEEQAYAVNIHPTYLPKARGMMPIPRIIMDEIKDAAGFTAHKMTQDFDAGDILLQEKIDLSKTETVETYTAKISMRAPGSFSKLIAELPELWKKAKPQDHAKASFLTAPKDNERIFDWQSPVHDIDRIGRAFGRFGSIAHFDNQDWVVFDYDFWKEKHDYKPGTIVAHQNRTVTIAAQNGFICLKHFQPLQKQ